MEDGDPLGSQPCPRDVISCPVLRTPFLGVKKHMTLAWGCLVPFLRPFLVGMGRERRLPSVGTYPDTDPSLIATHHEQALGGCDLRSGLPRHPVLRTCQLAYVTASQLHRIPPTRTQWHPPHPRSYGVSPSTQLSLDRVNLDDSCVEGSPSSPCAGGGQTLTVPHGRSAGPAVHQIPNPSLWGRLTLATLPAPMSTLDVSFLVCGENPICPRVQRAASSASPVCVGKST